jgi:uncharacterized membrane protein
LHNVLLFLAAFLASSVEMVEALTIVLAAGVTRGWRSTSYGVGAAIVALTVIVAGLGPALTRLPIDALRLVVGTILLVFGLQWLRKAILRAGGYKSLHDEDAIFRAEVAGLSLDGTQRRPGVDWYAFTVAFKVVTFGSTQHNVGLAALAATAALVLVVITGAIVHAPLSRVPENTLKFGVGVMLSAFGMFWSAEGAGASWPGGDASIVGLIAFVLLLSFALVTLLRSSNPALPRQGVSV